MKVLTNYNLYFNSPVFKTQKTSETIKPANNHNKNGYYIAAGASVGALAGGIAIKKSLTSKYICELAKDLSAELNQKIKPSQLNAVMDRKEFLKTAKNLKEENYIASADNIKNGTFIADLHSHSNFSDGTLSVEGIMNQAAEYGDRLHKINGKKFIFALSDHDGIEGVKEALKIIAKNPKKFKNIKFVPAAELSFPTVCETGSKKFERFHNDIEIAEVLIYNINPFSKTTEDYFKNLYNKRQSSLQESIKKASEKLKGYNFSKEEYTKFWNPENQYWRMNQHWGVYHYLNLKTKITDLAKNQNKNPEKKFDEILTSMYNKNPKGLNSHALDKHLGKPVSGDDIRIIELKPDILPKTVDDLIKASGESSFESIAEFACRENAVLAFAHPGFTIQNKLPQNALKEMQKYVEDSHGTLLCAEKYHQAYPVPGEISREEIEKYNKVIDELGLINIGGRDNHSMNFTNFPKK